MKTIVEQFKADLTDGLARYNAKDLPAGRLDGIIEQLLAMIRFIEATVDGTSELLAPLRAHAEDLMNLQHGHQPQGLLPGAHQGHPPLTVQETMRRGLAIAVMENAMHNGKSENSAASAAARQFPGTRAGQIKNWRKKAKGDPALKNAAERGLWWVRARVE